MRICARQLWQLKVGDAPYIASLLGAAKVSCSSTVRLALVRKNFRRGTAALGPSLVRPAGFEPAAFSSGG